MVVAATTGAEQFLNVGERWRHYRTVVEDLKSRTWTFLVRAAPYEGQSSHEKALPLFATEVERTIAADVTRYVGIVTPEKDRASADPVAQDEEER